MPSYSRRGGGCGGGGGTRRSLLLRAARRFRLSPSPSLSALLAATTLILLAVVAAAAAVSCGGDIRARMIERRPASAPAPSGSGRRSRVAGLLHRPGSVSNAAAGAPGPLLPSSARQLLIPPRSGTEAVAPSEASAPPRPPGPPSLLEKMFLQTEGLSTETLGAGGVTSFQGLLRADEFWSRMRRGTGGGGGGLQQNQQQQPPHQTDFVRLAGADEPFAKTPAPGKTYDAVVCGGTLGVFVATALLARNSGLKIAIVERGRLRGRDQDWNIARSELGALVKHGILSAEEVEEAIRIEFNPMRVGFETPRHGGFKTDVNDVLNIGVSPETLVRRAKERFLALGGEVMEGVDLKGVDIASSGAFLRLGGDKRDGGGGDGGDDDEKEAEAVLKARLVIDAMGGGSPISRQARGGAKPDGVCLVVGSSATSEQFAEANRKGGDLIYSFTPALEMPTLAEGQAGQEATKMLPNASSEVQLFWEAFPASSGPRDRTTYMFAYMDVDESRPSLQRMFEEYTRQMPVYQGLDLRGGSLEKLVDSGEVRFNRLLYAVFPSYAKSPIRYPDGWDRVTSIGDASGVQSPLSFGGFGALLRHLPRTVDGISEALANDVLDRRSLSGLNPYLPNLASTWMMQRSMSAPAGGRGDADAFSLFRPKLNAPGSPGPEIIADLLAGTFEEMLNLDEGKGGALQPFLQDVVQPGGLLGSLAQVVLKKPALVPRIVRHVGVEPIADWVGHVGSMLAYDSLNQLLGKSGLASLVEDLLPSDEARYRFRRQLEAYEYGSGSDFTDDHLS